MGPGMFDGLDKLMWAMAVLSIVGIVLGIYEAVRIVWWVLNHVSIN